MGIPVVTNQKLLRYQYVHCHKCWLYSSFCLRNNFAIGATIIYLNVYLNINNSFAIYKIFSDFWKWKIKKTTKIPLCFGSYCIYGIFSENEYQLRLFDYLFRFSLNIVSSIQSSEILKEFYKKSSIFSESKCITMKYAEKFKRSPNNCSIKKLNICGIPLSVAGKKTAFYQVDVFKVLGWIQYIYIVGEQTKSLEKMPRGEMQVN